MAIFSYEATDQKGTPFRDKVDAESKDEVLMLLSRKNLIPIKVIEEGKDKPGLSLDTNLFESVTALDKITLVRNLAVTIKAGLNIIEAIQILIVDTNKKTLRDILENAKASLERGQPLSSTFAEYPKHFTPVFTGLIEAGEASGHLDVALEQLAEQLDKEYKLGKKVKSALAYPAVLLVASILVVALLLIFVLPRLAQSFRMSGVELPTITKVLMSISGAVSAHPLFDLLVVFGFIGFLRYFKGTRVGHKFFLNIGFKLPLVNELIKKVALVRFSRNLSTLIGSGINIIDALKIASDTVGNDIYKEMILSSVAEIKNGIALSDTIKNQTKYFPHLLVNMIAVGERTGTLEYVLKTFANFYEDEVDNTLKNLTTFLEPIMLLVMGLIIGAIALSILLPIYQLIGKFT